MKRPLKILAEIIAVILVLCAIVLGVTRALLLPHIDRYKPYLESWVSGALHQTVKVEKIQAIWQGLHPEIEMDNVRIFDSRGVQHLYVERLQLGIKLIPSLIQKKLVPNSLLIANTHLQVRRMDENTLMINGFLVPVKESTSNSKIKMGAAIDWLLKQGQIKLADIGVDFQMQDGQLFHITHASVQLKRGLLKDQLIGIATLSEQANTRFRFVVKIKQMDEIYADCYLYLQNLDLTTLNIAEYFPNLKLTQGHLSNLQIWGTWKNGYWQQIQAAVEARQAVLESKTWLSQPVQLNALDANIFLQPQPNGFNLSADKVDLVVNQQVWPLTRIHLAQTLNQGSTQVTQHWQIDALDLAQLSHLVSQSTAGIDSIQPLLAAIKPQGILKNIVVQHTHIPMSLQNTDFRMPKATKKQEFCEISRRRLEPIFPLTSTKMQFLKSEQNILLSAQVETKSEGGARSLPVKVGVHAAPLNSTGIMLVSKKPNTQKMLVFNDEQYTPIYYQAARDLFFINTAFQALKTTAWHQIPAIDGLQGKCYVSPNSGNLELAGNQLLLGMPTYFDHSFKLQHYAGKLEWVKSLDGLTLNTKDLVFSDANLAARTQFMLFLPEQSNGALPSDGPSLKLAASFSEKDAGQLKKYMPTVALHNHTALSDWLKNAFVSGSNVNGKIQFEGMLSHFPFDDHTGSFNASIHTNNLQFNYKTEWPQVFNLNADAVFHNRQLAVQVSDASIFNIHTGPVQAKIANLAHAELDVFGQLQTNIQTALQFIQKTPLQKKIGEGLDKLVPEGAIKLALKLHLPLYKDAPPPNIKGDVTILPPAKLDIPSMGVHLTDLQGAFTFTENALLADQMSAQWLNQPINMAINTSVDPAGNHTILVKANGRINLSVLQNTYALDFLKNKVSGSANYQSVLKISRQDGNSHAEFDVDSDLKGMAIQLPAPLQKQADDKRDTHVAIKFSNQSALYVFAKYAKLLTTTITLAKNQQNNWYFKQGNFQFGQIPKQTFSAAQIIVQPQSNNWLVKITSPTILGKLSIPSTLNGPIIADFDRFRLIPGESSAMTQMNPGDIPPLNLTVKNFSYEDKPFGRFYLKTASAANLLQIQQLNIDMGDNTHLAATGRWQQISKGRQQTTISGNMNTKNLGVVLKNWQLTSSLLDGNGSIAFALAWPDAVNNFSVQQLNGDFSLAFKKGRIINISDSKEAKLGIGRILNLLSLQSISRRLSLDFGDLSEKGFGFDDMKGDFSMQNGTAMTQNAYLKGPIAKIAIKGKIGAVNKSYDINMQVTPYITGSLPVAAAIVGGPVLGVATWLGSKVLSGVVNKIVSRAYQITGTWENPIVQPAQ